MDDIDFMREAYAEAVRAFKNGETPVGCVITRGGSIIARAANERNARGNALSHAEMLAIGYACEIIKDWRLEDCRLYVTVEPCPMCAGAIVQARIPIVIYGAANPKAGCAGSVLNILDEPRLNHRCTVISGVMGEECAELMSRFFSEMRLRAKAQTDAVFTDDI
jgi:tRNA(adenine34) deaminase